jgi:hypothetical protein
VKKTLHAIEPNLFHTRIERDSRVIKSRREMSHKEKYIQDEEESKKNERNCCCYL